MTLNAGAADTGTLPESDLQSREGAKPPAHGSAVQAVFNDLDDLVDLELDAPTDSDSSTYQAFRDLWREELAEPEEEPLVLEVDSDAWEWLPGGKDWVLLLESSRWKCGTGVEEDYRAWYQYHLKLRSRTVDDDGEETYRKEPIALHVEVIPQHSELNYRDGNDLTLPHGEGTLVRTSTTWAERGEEVESRMLDALELAVGADRDALEECRRYQSRRVFKAETHHRVHIGYKRQIIDALDSSRQLIAYGGQSEIQASARRQREGYLESLVDADRWHLLGFPRTDWNIELKCYQAPGWTGRDEDEPARHPKLESSFAGVDGDGSLPHVDEWDEVLSVLRSIVLAHLDWAGVDREDLVADEYQPGPAAETVDYSHPSGRREQLRKRYESVSTEIYREATKQSTTAVYDILKTVATEDGASYDTLEERTGLARSTIRYHVKRLEESRVVTRVGNPVLVVFPSLQVLEKADEILQTIYPDDMVEDMLDRADERRERREEREEERDRDDEDSDISVDDAQESDEETTSSSGSSSEWEYLSELALEPHQLANALERDYLDDDEVRVRLDRREWIERRSG